MNRLLKRIIPAAALAFIISQSAFAAKPGDIIGDVYPTDIKTYIPVEFLKKIPGLNN